MELIIILFVLLFLLAVITVTGHLMWVFFEIIIKAILGIQKSVPTIHPGWSCLACNVHQQHTGIFCVQCRAPKPSPATMELIKDLAATERQIERFQRQRMIDSELCQFLKDKVTAEYERLKPVARKPEAAKQTQPSVVKIIEPVTPPSVVDVDVEAHAVLRVPTFKSEETVADEPERPVIKRRSFSEVLHAFMEESNIRWGEIIGGLLIIGCSTALVVSLWAQISEIPVLKFLIFTTVTAALFGIGLYTEHRWKLPTTSRGILTIATLLVPLNFLAIAAVSLSTTAGTLVVISELVAPAVFLCLVYFAGRVITPRCANLLSAGVLSSSVGQLLVRHFAVEAEPLLMVLLGAFPVCCYTIAIGLTLKEVLSDREITNDETTTVFSMLGIMSFASILPFGLLLYRSGPLSWSMMYLAPIVTLWSVPILAVGSALWNRIKDPELVAARVAGSALALLGVAIVVLGVLLAWPNPGSIVPAALLNFAVFTTLAVLFNLPVAHGLAAGCFALATLVVFHVSAGHISWQNLRVASLVETCLTVSSGQALVGVFALFAIVSEWLLRSGRKVEGRVYLYSAGAIAVLSLSLATLFGWWQAEYQHLWMLYGFYAVGACWFALRLRREIPGWVASFLLLITLADLFSRELSFAFPWQTSLLVLATMTAVGAIVCSRYQRAATLVRPLNYASLISLTFSVVSLFQTNSWQVTSMQAERLFWMTGIVGLSLWLNRKAVLFAVFQAGLVVASVLTVKAFLQQFEWYSYRPHAFMHPAALEIQGMVLVMLCLLWIALRLIDQFAHANQASPITSLRTLLHSKYAVDRILLWALIPTFMLLVLYGSVFGIVQEFVGDVNVARRLDVAGFSHLDATGIGAWALFGLLLVVLVATYFQRRAASYLYGAMVTAFAAVPLLAAQFENQLAGATAFRWFAALFLLIGSVLVWTRSQLEKRLVAFGLPPLESGRNDFCATTRFLLITCALVPLALLTIYPLLRTLSYSPVGRPNSGLFALMDETLLYGVPLLITAGVFIGYAIRERLTEYAFCAGLVINFTVNLSYMLTIAVAHGPIDRVVLVQLAQLNAITFATCMLPWLASRAAWIRLLNANEEKRAQGFLKINLLAAVLFNVLLIGSAASVVMFDGAGPEEATFAVGGPLGWLSFLTMTLAAGWWVVRSHYPKFDGGVVVAWLSFLSCLVSFQFLDEQGLVAGRVLTVLLTLTALVALLILRLTRRSSDLLKDFFELTVWERQIVFWVSWLGLFTGLLSLRYVAWQLDGSWVSVCTLLLLTGLFAYLNWRTLSRRHLYAAGILFHLGVSVWWRWQVHYPTESSFYFTNIITGSLAGIGWLFLELRSRKLRDPRSNAFSFHNIGGLFGVALLTLLVTGRILLGDVIPMSSLMSWLAFGALGVFLLACLWDKTARHSLVCLYWLGLLAGALALHQLELPNPRLAWCSVIYVSAYTIMTAYLWRERITLLVLARRLGIPRRVRGTSAVLPWLAIVTPIATISVLSLTYWMVLRFVDFQLRITAASASIAIGVAFALLAERSWRERWRRTAAGVFIAGTILLAWSFLTPGVNATWLNRSVVLMVVTFALTSVYVLCLKKVKSLDLSWSNAMKFCVPFMLSAGLISLIFSLSTEVFYQLSFGAVRVSTLSMVAIAATLIGAICIGILFAISPQHEPLNLQQTGRMAYVYAAEVMLALLFLHIRLTMPWLFTGMIERYWPLIVMAVAYLGVVVSELLRRRELLVLSRPLERTGAFLPLLPVLGFWIAGSRVDFSMLLFVVGGLYGLLAVLRRSFAFGLLAAAAGNSALWYVLQRTDDYQFLQHPQLWLIPVALSVLLAAYLNEDNLAEDQMTSIRYLSLVTIYVSSTADIFINGVPDSPWLPLILASLSLAGVFGGILFKVRGMLLLGSIFLLLSIVTMIWYGAENFGWTWLWYVAGIATGATIIFMFAVFEKKRSEVLRVVDGLRDWDR